MPLRELEVQKKAEGHIIFEEWRNKTDEQILAQFPEYAAAVSRSFAGYQSAFDASLARL